MAKKIEAKSTVSTKDGMVDIKVTPNLTPEDLIEHMCKCVLGEIAGAKSYDSFKDNIVLNRDLKNMIIIRKG